MPRSHAAARDLIELVGNVLEAGGLRAALIGGQAVNCWVEPRITLDVDVTVMASGATLREVVQRFELAGFRILFSQDPGGQSGPDFVRFEHEATEVELDLEVAKTDYEAGMIERAVRAEGLRIPVARAEDVLVLKLIANRGKDHKDQLDLARLSGLDWAYIEHWADVWQVSERLGALREAVEADRRQMAALYDDPAQVPEELRDPPPEFA
ncbi:MAG: nucleotidyl transferase AbiEii/AbiGii toxin family protein [Tepidiformaceae bacterium]